MNVEMTLDKVLVKPYILENKSKITLLNTTQNESNKLIFEVVKIGNGGKVGDKNIDIVLKEGDIVVIPEWIGSIVEIEGQIYRIVKQEEVLAILTND